MTMMIKKYYWYFKKGRNEGNILIGISNFIMLVALSSGMNVTIPTYIGIGVGLTISFIIVGKLTFDNVESEYFRTVPFHNDDTKYNCLIAKGLEALNNGDIALARLNFEEAYTVKEKWL